MVGSDDDSSGSTMEYYSFDAGEFLEGPNLPEQYPELNYACAVQMDDSTVLITGGYDSDYVVNSTFAFDFNTNEYTEMAQMKLCNPFGSACCHHHGQGQWFSGKHVHALHLVFFIKIAADGIC